MGNGRGATDTMQYQEYLTTEDWKAKRAFKLRHARNCAVCGVTKNIDIHHFNYRNLTDVQPLDLIRLCRQCHFLLHDLFKANRVIFQRRPISLADFRKRSYYSQLSIAKLAIKKARGFGYWTPMGRFIATNMFSGETIPPHPLPPASLF